MAPHRVEHLRFSAYLALGYLLFPIIALVRFGRTKKSGRDMRILVVPIMTRVGDLICSTPVYRRIKEELPEAHLAVLVAKKAVGIVATNPHIDQFVNVNDPPFKGFFGRGRLFLYIFRMQFDAVVLLSNNPFNNLIALYSAAPIRVKTVIADRSLSEALSDWFNTNQVAYQHGSSILDQYVSLLAPLGIAYSSPIKELFVRREGEEKAASFLGAMGNQPRSIVISICVSAGNRVKEWPLLRFSELAGRLLEEFPVRIVFIDSPGNASRIREVIEGVDQNMRQYLFSATDFSLEDLPSLVKKMNAVIAVDTGIVHVAHALGVPLIDIVGPVHPGEQVPHDDRSVALVPQGIAPSIFAFKRAGLPKETADAVLAISVDQVLEAFREMVKRGIVSS